MKNIVLILFLLLFVSGVNAQESVVDLFKSKEKREKEKIEKNEKQKALEGKKLWEKNLPKTPISTAGLYLEKSAKLQSVALGLGTVSTGLFVWYGCTADKFTYEDGDTKLTSKAKGLIASGAVFAIAAIGCEIMSLNYKFKAGTCLKLHTAGDKVGLAFVF